MKRIFSFGTSLALGVCASGVAGSPFARGLEPPPRAAGSEASQVARPPVDVEGVPDIGPVYSAKSLRGALVTTESGAPAGRIEDVGIDFGRGGVSAVFVKPPATIDAAQQTLTVPVVALDWQARKPDIVLRGMDGALPDKKVAEPDAETKVVLMSAIAASPIEIVDAQGKRIGHVVDFGLARQKGLIAFAVCELNAGPKNAFYPIPLTAFMVDAAASWRLELSKDVVEATPTFQRDHFPESVERAWLEYVHVRYGRSPLGGVRFAAERQGPSPK